MKRFLHIFLFLLAAVGLASCSVSNYIPDGEYYLKDVSISTDDEAATKNYNLSSYILQVPNSKWFVAKVPLGIYMLSGSDTTRWTCRLLRKLGEAPRLYDAESAQTAERAMEQMLANEGYMHANVVQEKTIKGKKMKLDYHVQPGKRYFIRRIHRNIDNNEISQLLLSDDTLTSYLREGMPFNVNRLNEERSRITSLLRDNGYYHFVKDHISFLADTLEGSTMVDITMNIGKYVPDGRSLPEDHRKYYVGDITFLTDYTNLDQPADSFFHGGHKFIYQGKRRFRANLLQANTAIEENQPYSESQYRLTLTNLSRLSAFSFSNVRFAQRPSSDTLDCFIIANHAQPKSISFEVEGTNSAGDLGAATSASFQHKNLFRGSETFTFKIRGAYEAITGLDGYEGHNYIELGAESRLAFPGFYFPFITPQFAKKLKATSEIALQYNLQNRPEFRRRVLTAAWRYRWTSPNQRVSNKFDLLEINYVHMPWISRTFKEQYLDSIGRSNAILAYNYENLLITKLGYSFTYNSLGTSTTTTYGKNAIVIHGNLETSGNVLNAWSHLTKAATNNFDQYKFCGIAFAQYIKGDFDFSKSIRIDNRNSMAFRFGFGLAYPYGNSKVLPFEKRYFSGGANSVRGWSVRSLGPGTYNSDDRGINFINQSGDIKLDASIEYRTFLFWKINGAVFVDAGNIWTIHEYADQPGGCFYFHEFYKQIAVSYGIGLRLALDFFTIRFDGGMKAINPAYTGSRHYPIAHPNLRRDFAFHFAVGLPF